MKKKILFVHIALWTGGIETALTSMLDRMDYDKYDVTCLILSDQQELAYRVPEQCHLIFADRQHMVTFSKPYHFNRLFNIIEEPSKPSKLRKLLWKCLQFLLRNIEEYLYSRYIRKNMGDTCFDSVVLFSSKACGIGTKIVKASKYICFYHYSDLRRVYHDKKGYDRCSHIFAVSENMANRLKSYLPQYSDKIEPLHNLVNTMLIRNKALEDPSVVLPYESFNIVSCGRLVEDKGFDLAIDACSKLVNREYINIQWYVLGEGPKRSELQNIISNKQMGSYFHLLGLQGNPYAIIDQADLYVQPSRIESFGLTITEALVLGKPVISTKTDGGTELISDRENGLLCDVSPESIAAQVQLLIDNPQLRKQLADNAAAIDFEMRNNDVMRRLYMELD